MILPRFEYHQPRTVDEALAIARQLEARAERYDYVAGGTDLLPNYKMRLNARPHVISLGAVAALRELSATRIGALVTLDELVRSPILAAALPVLPHTAMLVASPLLRAAGTLGGNLLLETRCYYFNQSDFWRHAKGGCMKDGGRGCLVVPQEEVCYAAYSADLAPVLMTLGATVELAGFAGTRHVALTDFFRPDGISKNIRGREEILVAVHVPAAAAQLRAVYDKLRVRDTIDFPLLGIAAAARLDETGVVAELRLAATAVDTVPLWLDDIARSAVGERLTPQVAERLGEAVRRRVQPVKNLALRPLYRKRMAGVLTRRVVGALATNAAQGPMQ